MENWSVRCDQLETQSFATTIYNQFVEMIGRALWNTIHCQATDTPKNWIRNKIRKNLKNCSRKTKYCENAIRNFYLAKFLALNLCVQYTKLMDGPIGFSISILSQRVFNILVFPHFLIKILIELVRSKFQMNENV